MTEYLVDSQQSARELYRVGLESVAFLLAVGDADRMAAASAGTNRA